MCKCVDVRMGGCVNVRICEYADVRMCGCANGRICKYAFDFRLLASGF